jgi:hypothetical protein
LHAIAKTLWMRGVASDAFQEDVARIEEYLATGVASDAHGVAIFASAGHHLFETLEAGVPFDNQVSASAVPSLFQLARLLDDQQTAVIALVRLHIARLFVISRGLLHEVRGLRDDPKFYHKVRRANGLNQPRYQRHADQRRQHFARETAARIEHLVTQEQAMQIILAGEDIAVHLVREALSGEIAPLVQEHPLRLDLNVPSDTLLEEVEPLLREAEADQDRSVVERLLEAVQSDELGVSGVEQTRAALEQGQADVLVLAREGPVAPEVQSELIDLAVNTSARVELVEQNAELSVLGSVGALLRYRAGVLTESGVPSPAKH